MTDDLEARLRRMYSAVANRTAVGSLDTERPSRAAPTEVDVVPIHAAPPGRIRMFALTAAAAVVLLGGLVLLRPRSADAPSEPAGALRHALPLESPRFIPTRFGSVGGIDAPDRTIRLSQIESSATGDVLTYEWDAGGVSIATAQQASSAEPGVDVSIRGGLVARVSDSTTGVSLSWFESGVTVTITAFGEQGREVDELVRLANGIAFVDDDAWARATEFAGFSRTDELIDFGGGWTLSGSLRGDGISVRRGGYGFSASVGSVGSVACFVYADAASRDWWFVVADPRLEVTTATLPQGDAVDISLRRLPGTNLAVGEFTTKPLGGGDTPKVACEEEET